MFRNEYEFWESLFDPLIRYEIYMGEMLPRIDKYDVNRV